MITNTHENSLPRTYWVTIETMYLFHILGYRNVIKLHFSIVTLLILGGHFVICFKVLTKYKTTSVLHFMFLRQAFMSFRLGDIYHENPNSLIKKKTPK